MGRLPLNHTAFAVVTDASAYWAGFLMADGCVYRREGWTPSVSISGSIDDEQHMRAFLQFVGAYRHRVYVQKDRRRGREWRQVAVTSARIADDLAAYGVVPRKSFTARAGACIALNRHFWRGVVDGDGHLGVYGTGRAQTTGRNGRQYGRTIGLYGSPILLEQFRTFLLESGVPVEAGVLPHKGIARITLKGAVADATATLLYADCVDALPRKHRLAKTVFEV